MRLDFSTTPQLAPLRFMCRPPAWSPPWSRRCLTSSRPVRRSRAAQCRATPPGRSRAPSRCPPTVTPRCRRGSPSPPARLCPPAWSRRGRRQLPTQTLSTSPPTGGNTTGPGASAGPITALTRPTWARTWVERGRPPPSTARCSTGYSPVLLPALRGTQTSVSDCKSNSVLPNLLSTSVKSHKWLQMSFKKII